MKENENQQVNKKENIRFFNAKNLGGTLQEVAVDILKCNGQDIESRWFHSKNDADLFIWNDYRKNILKQQVIYYGQVIEWNLIEGLRTGVLIEDENSQQMGSSPLIQYDLTPQRHAVTQSVELIGCIPGLSNEVKTQIIYNFTQATRLVDMKPADILFRYGKNKTSPPQRDLGFSLMRRVWSSVLKYLIKSND